MSGPSTVRSEKVEGFVVGAAGEEVFEAGRKGALVLLMPRSDLLGDLLEGFELGVGVAVAELVVGDDGGALLEEGGEVGVKHGERLIAALLAAMIILNGRPSACRKIERGRSGVGLASLRYVPWGD